MDMTATLLLLLIVVLLFLVARFNIACRNANLTDWGHPALNFLDGLNRLFCHHYHRLNRIEIGMVETGPAVVVSNHISGLDPMLLIAAARRPLRFLIAKEQYERFGLQWLFRAVGCIPVDRKGRPDIAMRAAINALSRGEVVAVFPHGKIHLPHHPETRLKSGAATLAVKAECPIYPVRLSGMKAQGHVLTSVILRGKTRLEICNEIQISGLEIADLNKKISDCIDS